MTLANIRNGLVYPHEDLCAFQSNHAHDYKFGYFRNDAMPYKAIVYLLLGGTIKIVDGTKHDKPLSDALLKGVPTFCLVFNRALKIYDLKVCDWQTKEMYIAANLNVHKELVDMIRKLNGIYGHNGPAVIGKNVLLTCHKKIDFDDDEEKIKEMVKTLRRE